MCNSKMWFIILLCIFCNKAFSLTEEDFTCPTVCTCRIEHLTELAIYKYMKPEYNHHHSEAHEVENNDVFYDDTFDNKHNVLIKTATCILQTETEPEVLLAEMPLGIQAITLIQGFESGNKTLKLSSLKNFTDLTVLELQGTKSYRQNTSIFFCEIDAQLENLKYLNLEQVLIKNFNKKDDSNAEEVVEFVYLQKNGVHNLTLIRKIEKNNILPYEKYIEQQEKNQLPFFIGFKSLNLLIIRGCELNHVQWEMFEGLSDLEFLILEKNNIKFVPNFAFYGTPNLKVLSLAHNKLLNIQVTDLAGLLKLEYLDLSHNNFSHLSELSLPPFPNLKLANFGENPISFVFPNTFEVMNTTDSLVLGSADIPLQLQKNSFLGLKLLKKLILKHLKIPVLKREVFIGMPKLHELALSGEIPEIEYDAFVEVNHLENLILKKSNIRNISMDAFIGLKRLKVLDLSFNQLNYLSPGVFDVLTSLEELYLNYNNFTKLPRDIFRNIHPKLLRLNNNPWHCSCEMSEWKPVLTNKIKRKTIKVCDSRLDKGVGCTAEHSVYYKYYYNNKVSPKCASPNKFKNLSVYPVMRRQLMCKDFKPKLRKQKSTTAKKVNEIMNTTTIPEITSARPEYTSIEANTTKTNHIQNLSRISKHEKLEKLNMKLNKLRKKGMKNSSEDAPMKVSLFKTVENNEEDNDLNSFNSMSRIADTLPLSFKAELKPFKYDSILQRKYKKQRKLQKSIM